jgi:hypothetical protein
VGLIRRACNRRIGVVLETIPLLIGALALACRGHRELVLENLALRQQLNTLKRTVTRPRLQRRDRVFWIVLAKTWRHWRGALVLVQPDAYVFGSTNGEYQPTIQTAWETLKQLTNGTTPKLGKEGVEWNAQQLRRIDLRWHDLRHHAAPRIMPRVSGSG